MHPDADAFLDVIFETPGDDTPRLVYADWLQEHGQEAFAQFIRLQCAAAREKLWSDEANRLWEEIGSVWTRLDEEWWPATRDVWNIPGTISRWNPAARTFIARPALVPGLLDAIHFHRGFLRDSMALTAGQLLCYGNSCWPWLPLPTTALELDGAETKLLAWRRTPRIRSLRVTGWGDNPNYVLFVATSPAFVNLEILDLTDGVLVESDVDHLLRPDQFPRLREIRLRVHDSDFPLHQQASLRHREMRQRAEQRFKTVVWITSP